VSAISDPGRFAEVRKPATGPASVYDIGDCIKAWGRRGIFWGALFGFGFGTILVAIPLTSDILTFGVLGTLLVGTVECAVIAGAFAAFAAVLVGKGVRRGSAKQFEHILQDGRRSAVAGWRDGDVPLEEWPVRWAYPIQTGIIHLPGPPADNLNTAFQLPDATRPGTVDALEPGNAGP
jgi:hypothetical protein